MLCCGKCGSTLSEGDQFCSNCGTKISYRNNVCSNCGHLLNNNNAKFCGYCGCLLSRTESANNVKASSQVVNSNQSYDFIIEDNELKAYKGNSTDVIIPEGVKYIGEGVFQGSGVTSVILPESLIYIGHKSFANCYRLQEIKIPSSVEDIQYDAFNSNPNIKIIWPKSWETRIDTRISLAAEMKQREVYIVVTDPQKIKKGQNVTLVYFGRNSKKPYYYFCEKKELYFSNNIEQSIFDYPYEIEFLNRSEMYSDLAELFDLASLNINMIGTIEVPYYGCNSISMIPDTVKNGLIQLFTITMTVEYGEEDS